MIPMIQASTNMGACPSGRRHETHFSNDVVVVVVVGVVCQRQLWYRGTVSWSEETMCRDQ